MEKNVPCRYLTNEGIQYLRDYLHLPSEIVPSTLKHALPRGDARPARTAAPRPGGDKPEGDRAAYRYVLLVLSRVLRCGIHLNSFALQKSH